MAEKASKWGVHIVEWSVVAVLLVVMITVFGRQVQVVQGQAERGLVLSTLGALRTAFVIDHLRQATLPVASRVAFQQRNPFLLLERKPANYAGEFESSQLDALVPGSWIFDPVCSCIGYMPKEPQWLESPPGALIAWFQISPPPGPFQITATQPYVWQGQAVN